MADNGNNNRWLKVLIGVIITILVAGFGFFEVRKLDSAVFDIHKDAELRRYEDIKDSLKRIETKVDALSTD